MSIRLLVCILLTATTFSVLGSEQKKLASVVSQSIKLPALIENAISPYQQMRCLNMFHKKKICPKVLLDEEKENQHLGLTGITNHISNIISKGEDFSTPSAVCSKSKIGKAPHVLFEKYFPGFELSCDEELAGDDYDLQQKTRSLDYIASLAIDKKNQLTTNISDLLNAKYQIDMLIGAETGFQKNGKGSFCNSLENKENISTCENMEKCAHQDNQLFAAKSAELYNVVKTIQVLRNSIKNSSQNSFIEGAIKTVLETNPILKTDRFNKIVNNTNNITQDKFNDLYRKSLSDTRSTITKNIYKNNFAYLCLVGKSENCQDFSTIIRTAYGDKIHHSNETSANYQCLEFIKEAHKETDGILNNVALSVAFSFSPGGILKLGKTLSTLNLVGNTLWAATEILKIAPACEEKLKLIPTKREEFTCDKQVAINILQRDVAACTTQAIIAGVAAVVPAISLAQLGLVGIANNEKILTLLKSQTDSEFVTLINNYIGKIKSISGKNDKLLEIEKKIIKLQKADEVYTNEEIKAGLKIMMKRCL